MPTLLQSFTAGCGTQSIKSESCLLCDVFALGVIAMYAHTHTHTHTHTHIFLCDVRCDRMAQSDSDIGSLNSGTDKDDAFSGEQGPAAAMRQRRQAALAHRGKVRGGKRDGAGRRKGTVKKCLLKGLGRHTSEDTCPIRRGGKRPWGDRKNGNPKGSVCRVCCSAHKKLHPGLSLPELIKHMEEVPQARIEFDEGCQSYIDQQRERLVAVDLDRPQFREQDNLDGDADVEAANMACTNSAVTVDNEGFELIVSE